MWPRAGGGGGGGGGGGVLRGGGGGGGGGGERGECVCVRVMVCMRCLCQTHGCSSLSLCLSLSFTCFCSSRHTVSRASHGTLWRTDSTVQPTSTETKKDRARARST